MAEELSLTEIIKVANLKRKALGIKVTESKYLPQFKSKNNVVLLEGTPYLLEVDNGATTLRPYVL